MFRTERARSRYIQNGMKFQIVLSKTFFENNQILDIIYLNTYHDVTIIFPINTSNTCSLKNISSRFFLKNSKSVV